MMAKIASESLFQDFSEKLLRPVKLQIQEVQERLDSMDSESRELTN
jgi:hypothetical protein